ncbi:cytochrome C [Geoanaerobacter pelophilus]|uniref:Cytochrome C n=1 Tax=Geoanaerobacter pelophilus TaxID=60036 RepID=A0ABQ0MEC5_9BACT|nr:cytochrome C [Geoanaerobacter pelophilus]GAW65449.1 cytochrome C [Geoanaerobacter pelophilus]
MSKKMLKMSPLVAALALGGACGSALAAQHDSIVLRDRDGAALTADKHNNAFSMQGTCGACHNGSTVNNKKLLSYAEIERHNYHASLGQNELRGFNPFNADSTDAWRRGAAAPGKSWVQSPGHVGSW